MKVLISRPDKIGDVILSLHAAKQLKVAKPDYQIFMHVSDYTKELVENIKFIDGVITVDEPLNEHEFDAVVDLMAKPHLAKLYYANRIKTRIGNSARWFAPLYTQKRYIRRSKALINEAEYNWTLVSAIDQDLKHSRLKESLSLEDFKTVDQLKDFNEHIVVMPGVTASAVGWDVNNWLELIKLLSKENRVSILLGPAEKDLQIKFMPLVNESENITCDSFDSFSKLIGYLAKAKFYIGTSTGITHLAAASGCKGLALYPEKLSMHPRRWIPFDGQMQVVSLSKQPNANDVFQAMSNGVPDSLNPLRREKVTGFIICCNEEKNIRRALESIKWCDEILIVDSGSTDKTKEICKEYTDYIIDHAWEGHSKQKQFAIEQCNHDWIVNIDSDEEVSMELKGEILKVLSNTKRAAKGYNICRLIRYLNRWWDKGGWYPEYRLRFFQKKYAHWTGIDPHEKAVVKGRTKKLRGLIYHYTYEDINQQVQVLQKYALIYAREMYKENRKARLYNIFLNPVFRFFKFYIMKLGFREGFPGLVVAILESYYTYLKYITLWQFQHKLNAKDRIGNS